MDLLKLIERKILKTSSDKIRGEGHENPAVYVGDERSLNITCSEFT